MSLRGWGLLAALAGPAALAAGGAAEAPAESRLVLAPGVDEGGLPPEVVRIAREVRDRPLAERMAAVSRPWLGRPYRRDPIGEGVPPDTDPPARYDVFDCLSFVEEVLAFALAGDPTDAPAIRHSLRYGDGVPATYENRRHFMLEEWIPANIAAGWLEDVTAQVGETHLLVKEVTPATWASWRRRRLFALPDERLPVGTFALPVLSPGAALAGIDRIPDGALVLTVRASRPGVPIVVTHLGFKLPSEGPVPLMRHATRMGAEPRVRDERLAWYLEHVRWYTRWPVEGVSILLPRERGPRLSRLAEPAGIIPSTASTGRTAP